MHVDAASPGLHCLFVSGLFSDSGPDEPLRRPPRRDAEIVIYSSHPTVYVGSLQTIIAPALFPNSSLIKPVFSSASAFHLKQLDPLDAPKLPRVSPATLRVKFTFY